MFFSSAKEQIDVYPGENTFSILHENYKILIARTMVSFIPAFKCLRKHVCGHIPHPFQDKMSQKSEVVSLLFIIVCNYKFICLRGK